MKQEPILRIDGLSKTYPGVRTLQNVDFVACAGEVVALLGENGAGKSTLLNIVAGATPYDSGSITLYGHEIRPRNPGHAQALRIATICQESALTPNQSVAANIFMGREPRFGGPLKPFRLVNRRKMERDAARLLRRVRLPVDPAAPVRELSAAERQQVEIAKALAIDAKIVLMDEPASALGAGERESLFEIIRDLRARGRAIVFATHRPEDALAVGDRIVVLRDGACVDTLQAARTNVRQLNRIMRGRDRPDDTLKEAVAIGTPILAVEGLTRRGVVNDVAFEVRSGEILVFTGLDGAGHAETMRMVYGAEPKDDGYVWFDGHEINIRSPRDAVALGIGLVPRDGAAQGLVPERSVLFNLIAPAPSRFARAGWLTRRRARRFATAAIEQLGVRMPALDEVIMRLSGSDRQKVALVRWLIASPKVLMLDEPTRGVDTGARAEIHRLIAKIARQGVAIMMVSSDMAEILALNDRVVVMRQGRIAATFDRRAATAERIMAYASGWEGYEDIDTITEGS